MKLYYITRVNIPSGAAQSVQITAMCEAFNNEGVEFKLISTQNNENQELQKNFLWDRIELNLRFKYLKFVIKSFIKVRKEKPTHIFTRDIVVAFLLSFLNIKVVYEAHKEPKTKTASFMINFLKTKQNFFLVTISKALKSYYLSEYKYDNKKVLDCHDAVFFEKYDKYRNLSKMTLRRELKLPLQKTIIMHTGSLYKGNDAKLFKVVVDNFKDVLFVQVGGSESDIKKYQIYYKNNDNILFIAHQKHDSIVKYQMSADLLFYSLTKENELWWCTSPLKLFEYLATGVPILGSNIGSISEILDENNSILFNPEEEQSIVDGVNIFLNKKSAVQRKALQAKMDAQEKHTWQKRAGKILEFIGGG